MNIHIVQPGDTIYTIANSYGVEPERLSIENDIADPNELIIGETLIIIKPSQTYIVQEGDSIESIALAQGVGIMELLRNNPNISNRELNEGEELVISYADSKAATIKTNGFAYPFIDRDTLIKTLPYLTYLTIYSYQFRLDGSLINVDDADILQLAKDYDVAPIMFMDAENDGNKLNTDIVHTFVTNIDIQNTFIENILNMLHYKGYYGINIDTPYVQPGDSEGYVDFIANVTERLNNEGFIVMVTIAPSAFEVSTGIIYSGIDYIGLSSAANNVLYQLTYAWRYPYTLPISVIPAEAVLGTLANTATLIPPNKCMVGISNIGYLWEFPYFSAITIANFLNYHSAIELAKYTGSMIEFNETTLSAYFRYIESEHEYMAWFKDNRVIYPFIAYSQEYGFQGISIWNIMYFITSTWLMINAQYMIEKINIEVR